MLENIKAIVTLITIIVVIGIYAVNLYRKYKAQGKEAALADLRETAYGLFLNAEEKYSTKTGAEQMATVVTSFYKYITKDKFETLLPDTTVEAFLQDEFEKIHDKLKDFLDDGELNKSV